MELPSFLQTLKDLGQPMTAARFLENPRIVWLGLPPEVQERTLAALGAVGADPTSIAIKVGKRPNAPKSLENILVVVRWHPLAPSAPPAEGATAAPSPEPQPASRKKGLFGRIRKDEPAEAEPAAAVPETPAAPPATPESVAEPAPAPALATTASAEPSASPPASADAADEPRRAGLLGMLQRGPPPVAVDAPGDDGPITAIPAITDPDVETLDVYAVQEPYAYIRLLYDKAKHETVYEVIEPELNAREKNILEFIEDTLVDVIEIGLSVLTQHAATDVLRKNLDEIVYDYSIVLSPRSKEKLVYYILRDFLGYGKLDPIMRDDLIEDVSCDGPKVPIFLYHRKYESVKSNVMFKDHDEADSYVIRLAQRSGKHISIAEPLLDATLPNGSRLNATLAQEVTAGGSTFTIRKFRDDPFTPPDLVRFGTMNADILAYWWLAVQNGASAIYAGGTASGKTTSLNAILLFIPPSMKIVSIEDTREINLPHPNWIAGVTRSGFGPRDSHGRQAGEIDMFTLLKAALRQRPEYILVGEVRGAEAYALFQAMATGHTAYGTMHADSVESVIHRLESEPISIPRSLLEALDIVSIQIQTRIGGRRVRRTKELVEIVGLDPHTREILTNQVFTWSPATDEFEFSGVSYVLERIQLERNMGESEMRQELARRKEMIEWMIAADMHDYKTVGGVIASYFKDPEGTMKRCREEVARIKAQKEAEAAAAAPPAGSDDAPPPEAETEAAPEAGPVVAEAAPAGDQAATPAPTQDDEFFRRMREQYARTSEGDP
ncbi:MAG TPA: type II/IV secretion system ATPase subunit [Candidatus Thermoplasmatota archaeon]|nr:type II/IV secretion system ATPase subunit [Candidatus Thermoplasmatota archaeon]